MKTAKDIAILVSDDYQAHPYIDDILLRDQLIAAGYQVDILSWRDGRDFSVYQLAVIRSCWDYDENLGEFLASIEKISRQCRLVNSFSLVKANSDKHYLKALQECGIDIVPTEFIESIETINIPFTGRQLIIKPTVSASGRNTYRVDSGDTDKIYEYCRRLLKNKQVMIQPYIDTIEAQGEISSIVIAGQIVSSIRKRPAKGAYLVHEHWGGTSKPTVISEADRAFVEKIGQALREAPVYMRVDYLHDHLGNPLLLELELIEPGLFLSENPRALACLVQSLAALIS